ncbi:baseplate wedge protein 53 [bacterium]|nr:baseplate wedge protein 53 [bacterium]
MKYFENFPEVVYDGKRVKDITRRNRFVRGLQNNPLLYMPYTVEEGERAEDIANFYYGSVDYVWLIYIANNIIDPYHEWPLNTIEFNDMLIEKYAEASGLTGQDVLDWTRTDDTEDNIVYYYREV